jgi:hypothetical protein
MEEIPPSERICEKLKALMEGAGRPKTRVRGWCVAAARLIIEEALEGEARKECLPRSHRPRCLAY